MTLSEFHEMERACKETSLIQWEKSLKRIDLEEKDRVRGAMEAYGRQAFAYLYMMNEFPRMDDERTTDA